jgi:AcrR family transcriptional regulator
MPKQTPARPRRAGRPSRPLTKAEILGIARTQFAHLGFRATSLESLARAAGLRKASLLHHFPSKQALYLEVLGGVVADLMSLVEAARLDRGDHQARLDRLSAAVVDHLAASPESARLLLMELTDQGPYLSGPGREQVRLAFQIIERFLRQGMRAGQFRRQDPIQLAVSIVGLHLMYFAGAELVSFVTGRDVFGPQRVAIRRQVVVEQVRALCGAEGAKS